MSSSTPSSTYTRYALVSVWDKTHVADFCQALQERFGYGLIATGGTRTALEAVGLDVMDVATLTGFPEILDGRVKTLHPHVFSGILARRDNATHCSQMSLNIEMVVVNLYPFEAGLSSPETARSEEAMVELIDIGGVSLLRAAAKNFRSVAVVSHPQQYEAILADAYLHKGVTSLEVRQRLAGVAFAQCAHYDKTIAEWFQAALAHETSEQASSEPTPAKDLFPETYTLSLHRVQEMRYGENPHQSAALYATSADAVDFKLLHGKPLSYNNIMDMEAAWNLICEFDDQCAVAIIKHNQPCGVAVANTPQRAYERALDCDPLSAFGGIIALNRPVDEKTAQAMVALFTEVIIAPGFDEAATAVLQQKKNLRVVHRPWPHPESGVHPVQTRDGVYFRQVSPHLFLAQQQQFTKAEALMAQEMKVVTATEAPTELQLRDAAFAWKVVKHLKSNAIVIAKNGRTLGLSGGQTSRIAAVEHALNQACDRAHEAVLASDGFFPAVDNIHAAAQNRIGLIIQPAGSIKDAEVIQACEDAEITMVATGVREFRH
jgi:phosphoribosylaminoimidazolecarboxamide formyltransferase / IMP cyclohydrolase